MDGLAHKAASMLWGKEKNCSHIKKEEVEAIRATYEDAGQGHVFAFWDELSDHDRTNLLQQLSELKPRFANEIFKKALESSNPESSTILEPIPPHISFSTLDSDEATILALFQNGLEIISQNKVAIVLMAGGQGTRLGSDEPKGCFDVGLNSKKSLFQQQAERILRIQHLAQNILTKDSDTKVVLPWYIMTSGATHAATMKFFADNLYFGLQKSNIFFFQQENLPCFSKNGEILMESKSQIAVAPNGNGGIYSAFITCSVLYDMKKRGIEHVQAYCVDNSLVKVADPVFISLAAQRKASIATKVVRKREAQESVGLVVLKNGKPGVAEYSEIDSKTCEQRDTDNKLVFRAANIVNHYFSMHFLENITDWLHMLIHHVALKRIPYVDVATGHLVTPKEPNGIKLELFVFDVFSLVSPKEFLCMEVRREDEFSPLKNPANTGKDDPSTSRADIWAQSQRWLRAAGAVITSEDTNDCGVEVSPLLSYAGEGLEFMKGRTVHAPAIIEAPTQ